MGAGTTEPGAVATSGARPRRSARRLAVAGTLVAVAAAVPTAAGSASRTQQALSVPTGLQTFQLRLGDGTLTPAFSRTPSLAWRPVRGVASYELQLATSRSFSPARTVVWTARTSIVPAAAIPLGLPWLASKPGPSLWWRVRALGARPSGWSTPAGFRIGAGAAPTRLASPAGTIRWSPVPGATGYRVSFTNIDLTISTTTNVADLRDYHREGAPAKAVWRVRAERRAEAGESRAVPAVSHGPWSDTFKTPVRPLPSGGLATLSERPRPDDAIPEHATVPVFVFAADDGAELHHVYVARDRACRDFVLNSAIVGGGAFAPRAAQFGAGGRAAVAVNRGPVLGRDGKRIVPSEAGAALVDLSPGRYFWTVVPVERQANGAFRDLEHPRGACRAVRGEFTIAAAVPELATERAPFATGLSPRDGLRSVASPAEPIYGPPVVAWRPIAGATGYHVQWSRSTRPWRTAGSLATAATAATLRLTPGRWWYRVRGIDDAIGGDGALPWSEPARVEIAPPTYRVVES